MKLFLAVICFIVPFFCRNHFAILGILCYPVGVYLIVSFVFDQNNIPAQINSLKSDLNKLTKMLYVVYQNSQNKKPENNANYPKLPPQNIDGKRA